MRFFKNLYILRGGRNFYKALFFISIAAATIWMNCSMPGFQVSSLRIFLWVAGFAQSIANHSLFYPYALDFGIPAATPIAFGLSAAWPTAALIWLGLSSVDAYALTCSLWLILAFYSSFRLGLDFNNNFYVATLYAAVWCVSPMVVNHSSGYGPLALGFVLLSFYCLCSLRFLLCSLNIKWVMLFFLATIIAAFMDGYTFVLFLVLAGVVTLYSFIKYGLNYKTIVKFLLLCACFAVSAGLYKYYVNDMPMLKSRPEVFAAMGLGIKSWLWPANGISWVFDTLGINSSLNAIEGQGALPPIWGDNSKLFSFGMPLLLGALWGAWRTRKKVFTVLIIVCALISFWFACGPVFKFSDIRPEQSVSNPYSLPWHEFDYIPTGNAFTAKLPVLDVMRASFRWIALCNFCLWLLMLQGLGHIKQKYAFIWGCICLLVFLPGDFLDKGTRYRELISRYDAELLVEYSRYIHPGETIAFLPNCRDFSVGYLSSRLDFKTFNTAGDKNILYAQKKWPDPFRKLPFITTSAKEIVSLLDSGITDAVVLPYYSKVLATWPDFSNREYINGILNALAPLSASHSLSIESTPYFAIVRKNGAIRENHQ